MPVAHKVHFTVLPTLLDVKFESDGPFTKREVLSKAGKDKGISKQLLLSYKGINEGCFRCERLQSLM